MTPFRYRLVALLLVVCAASSFGGASARAGTAASDVAWLNEKRAAHGIPAGIMLDPSWSASCAQHLAYMRATDTVAHGEDPSSPAYTDAGHWAGTHSVLASGVTWTADRFIWEGAPLHLAQLLAPQLVRVGAADDDRLVCMTTWPGYTREVPATTRIVTYPGNGASIYASIATEEWPITPAEALGLRNPTGPHLYAYTWGPDLVSGDATLRAASVVGPDGPVDVRWVDRANPTVGAYLPAAMGIVIPTSPLRPDADYLATVTFSNGIVHAWTFTTRATRSSATLQGVRVQARRLPGGRRASVRVVGRLAGAAPGTQLTVRIGRVTRTVATSATGVFRTRLAIARRSRGTVVVQVRGGDATGAFVARLR